MKAKRKRTRKKDCFKMFHSFIRAKILHIEFITDIGIEREKVEAEKGWENIELKFSRRFSCLTLKFFWKLIFNLKNYP